MCFLKIKSIRMKKIITLIVFTSSFYMHAQNVGINGTGAAPNASAMLDIESTTSGLLTPRMTSTQRTAIATPATGLFVYDTTVGNFYYFDGVIVKQVKIPSYEFFLHCAHRYNGFRSIFEAALLFYAKGGYLNACDTIPLHPA